MIEFQNKCNSIEGFDTETATHLVSFLEKVSRSLWLCEYVASKGV